MDECQTLLSLILVSREEKQQERRTLENWSTHQQQLLHTSY